MCFGIGHYISATSMIPNILVDKAQVFQYDLPNYIAIHYGIMRIYVLLHLSQYFMQWGEYQFCFYYVVYLEMIAYIDVRLAKKTNSFSLLLAIGLGLGLYQLIIVLIYCLLV